MMVSTESGMPGSIGQGFAPYHEIELKNDEITALR
jgi:hypothetical protein